jgi:hypothetical protein
MTERPKLPGRGPSCYADGDIAEAGSRAGSVWEIVEVIRDGEAELRFIEKTVALALRMGDEKPVFKLKPTLRNNNAGICDRRAVGGNDDFGARKGLTKKRGSSEENESEQRSRDVSQSRIG